MSSKIPQSSLIIFFWTVTNWNSISRSVHEHSFIHPTVTNVWNCTLKKRERVPGWLSKVEHETLDLGVAWTPILGAEITFKKPLNKQKEATIYFSHWIFNTGVKKLFNCSWNYLLRKTRLINSIIQGGTKTNESKEILKEGFPK